MVLTPRIAERVLAPKLDARWISSEQQIMLLLGGPPPRQINPALTLVKPRLAVNLKR
jgi:hypothetical protein